MGNISKNEMAVLIEDLYKRVKSFEDDPTILTEEKKQLIEDVIGEFVSENSGRVEGMDDRQLGEYVKEVLDRTKKAMKVRDGWR